MTTEDINPQTIDIDRLTTREVLRRINMEDARVPAAVAEEVSAIASPIDRVVDAFKAGGRLIYVSAGTSGRLGVLAAAECPPTYNSETGQMQALFAGGPRAETASVEATEDDDQQRSGDVGDLSVSARDGVVGIAVSGRTPYVVGALRRARERGACTVALVGNSVGQVAAAAEIVIAPRTAPAVVAGSPCMKAGTAQKLVLNMISTAAMIRTGHTYGTLMVNVRATNSKLRDRASRIVAGGAASTLEQASAALDEAGGAVKVAIVVLAAHVTPAEAREHLRTAGGVVQAALSGRLLAPGDSIE